MAHPNCQISGTSPKKTPQSTPSKAANANAAAETTAEGTVASAEGGASSSPLPLQLLPPTQKFGCLRICRLSSLLLSMHC